MDQPRGMVSKLLVGCDCTAEMPNDSRPPPDEYATMTKLLTWACVLALMPVVVGLTLRIMAWTRDKFRTEEAFIP